MDATPLADRFSVGGNVILDNAKLTLTCADTDLDSAMAIGGVLVLTNGASVTLQSPCDPVEGDPGLVVTAGRLEMASGTWIYPYSHNTNGASVLFRIQKVALAPNAGFNANTKGYGAGFWTGSTGGAIYVRTHRFCGGNGIMSANGGKGSDYNGSSVDWDMPSAAGGRIALWYWVGDTNVTITVFGAAAPMGDDQAALKKYRSGEDGTIYIHQSKGSMIFIR